MKLKKVINFVYELLTVLVVILGPYFELDEKFFLVVDKQNLTNMWLFDYHIFIYYIKKCHGAWPSGKAAGFDPAIRRFESFCPSFQL